MIIWSVTLQKETQVEGEQAEGRTQLARSKLFKNLMTASGKLIPVSSPRLVTHKTLVKVPSMLPLNVSYLQSRSKGECCS